MVKIFISLILIFLFFLSPPQSYARETVVKMTESGFNPDEIKIETGDQLVFKNDDRFDHWPASDIHPTHQIYPEFDPKKAIKPGGKWEFKPQRIGSFKFHDHIFPHIRGTLIVEGESNVLAENQKNILQMLWDNIKNFWANLFYNIQGKNYSLPPKEQFLKLNSDAQFKEVEKIADKKGLKEAWDYINLVFKDSLSVTSGNAHDLAHLIGGIIYDKQGFEGMTICTPNFAFGCYHGFLDKAFLKGVDNLPKAEKACEGLGKINSGPYASCIHGIGHGLASYHQTKDLAEALKDCDKLSGGQQYCYDGVFMEFERNAPQAFYKKDNPLYPCDSLGETYQTSCGRNQVRVMLYRLNLPIKEVAGICLGVGNQDFQLACTDALGFNAVASSKGDTKVITAQCSEILDPDFKARCIRAASGELIFQNINGWQETSFKLCDSLGDNYREDCRAYINNLIKDYSR